MSIYQMVDFSLEEGDKIHITASHKDLEKFMISAGIYERKNKISHDNRWW